MTVGKKAVPKELLDSLLADYRKPEDLIGENGLLKQLTKLLVEKALDAELTISATGRMSRWRIRLAIRATVRAGRRSKGSSANCR